MLKIVWKTVEGTQEEKPEAVDTKSSPSRVYLRRNITQVTITPEYGETVKVWRYEEAELTREEYAEYEKLLDELNSPAMEQLKQDNMNLMAATADLYETQLAMQEMMMLGLADIYEAQLANAAQ